MQTAPLPSSPVDVTGLNLPEDQRALVFEAATLPVIDLSGLYSDDPADVARVAAELGAAGKGSGFFYIINHGIPQSLIDDVYAASKAFHAQPRDYKMQYYIGKSTHHQGYAPPEEASSKAKPEKKSYHETYDISFDAPADHPDYLAGYRLTGPQVFPDLPGFAPAVKTYYDAVYQLGRKMLGAFEVFLELPPGELLQHVNTPASQLRLLHYVENSAPADANNMGIGAHSDFECFTILNVSGPGLQVMNAEDYWVAAPPLPGTFIVNIGDCLEAWSGGLLKSTQHRVINTGRERFSLPLFFGTDYHTVVQPVGKYATEAAFEKYKPFVSGEHLLGQTIGGFRYLQDLVDEGKLKPTFTVPDSNPFEREAKKIAV